MLLGGLVVLLLAAGCGAAEQTAPATQVPVAPAANRTTVARVIDGDTFVADDGRTVRVLGIDSCELGTPGGEEARRAAESQFAAAATEPVTLTTEPGVETNPQGMLLRYVQLRGTDYGETMVPFDHTGSSAGDASARAAATYVGRLRSLDTRSSVQSPPVARDCDGPDEPAAAPTTTTTTAAPTTTEESSDDGDADRPYVPVPRRSSSNDSNDDSSRSGSSSNGSSSGGSRSGQTGHPCRAGERDGDKDGYCGET